MIINGISRDHEVSADFERTGSLHSIFKVAEAHQERALEITSISGHDGEKLQ